MSDRIRESREAWEVEVDVSEYDPERVRLRWVIFATTFKGRVA